MSLPCDGWYNAKDTSNLECPCGTWRKHWKKYSNGKPWPTRCSVLGCNNLAEDGAHVYHSDNPDELWIVPLCRECNSPWNYFELIFKPDTILVKADARNKCRP